MRQIPSVRRAGIALLLLAASALSAEAARPSYEAATAFGRTLQQDYAQRHGQALIDRLDDDEMRQRAFSAYGEQGLESESAKTLWKDSFRPNIAKDLISLEQLPALVPSRVLWIEGNRILECVLEDDKGSYQIMFLWLTQKIDGRILIADYRTLGSELEMTRRLRHLFLLTGAAFRAGLDEEEQEIVFRAEDNRGQIGQALYLLGQQKPREAFEIWSRLPPEIKKTRIWADIRSSMATGGCEPARQEIMREYHEGKLTNRFLQFTYTQKTGNLAKAITMLDQVIEEHHHPPFLLIQKAELLTQTGRSAEALVLAREVYRLNPFWGSAYMAGLHAAVASKQNVEALRTLEAWALFMPEAEIDRVVQSDPSLGSLIATPDYVRWEKAAAPTVISVPAT